MPDWENGTTASEEPPIDPVPGSNRTWQNGEGDRNFMHITFNRVRLMYTMVYVSVAPHLSVSHSCFRLSF